MSKSHKYLIVVAGPTAVGKTALCIQLAQHLRTEIVSADARQCYQGMAIGTAQPTAQELQAVPHHLVNFLPVQQIYSAGMFERDVLSTLDRLFCKHDCVLMTGGSGLYIQAVCQGLDTMPWVDAPIRATLNTRLQQEGLSVLARELAAQDPAYYQVVDRANPHRIIRALEVGLSTGKPYSYFRKRRSEARSFGIIKIGLTRDRDVLHTRIHQRVDQMMAHGLLQEAAALYPYRHYNALQTVGYRELFGYMAGDYDQAEAVRLLKSNTRKYAKRQLTWFRHDPAMRWFSPDHFTEIMHHIHQTIAALE